MGIDRKQRQPDAIVAGAVVLHDAFHRDAGLAFVEHDRLVVDDAPAVQHMGIDAGRVGAPAWIGARAPEVARGFQRHHVRRCLGAITPRRGDRDPTLKLDNAFVGAPQPAVDLQGPHGG